MLVLKNCTIYTGEQVLYNKALVIKDDKIFDIVDEEIAGEGIDLGGINLAPGFIDLQINGGGGSFFTYRNSKISVTTLVLTPTLLKIF